MTELGAGDIGGDGAAALADELTTTDEKVDEAVGQAILLSLLNAGRPIE